MVIGLLYAESVNGRNEPLKCYTLSLTQKSTWNLTSQHPPQSASFRTLSFSFTPFNTTATETHSSFLVDLEKRDLTLKSGSLSANLFNTQVNKMPYIGVLRQGYLHSP